MEGLKPMGESDFDSVTSPEVNRRAEELLAQRQRNREIGRKLRAFSNPKTGESYTDLPSGGGVYLSDKGLGRIYAPGNEPQFAEKQKPTDEEIAAQEEREEEERQARLAETEAWAAEREVDYEADREMRAEAEESEEPRDNSTIKKVAAGVVGGMAAMTAGTVAAEQPPAVVEQYEDADEDWSIEDVLPDNYQTPELERQGENGAEFITDGTKEIEGLGEVRTFRYSGGFIKENNHFYVDGKRQPYAYGESFEGETPVERFEEWEMTLAMEPKALAAAVDQFDLEEELGIPEFESLEDADAWADALTQMPAEAYDRTVNAAMARILNKIHGVEFSRDCKLARDMHDMVGSATESEGEDDVTTFGQLRGNRGALQMTFIGEDGSNVCSSPEAFQHILDSLSPADQASAKKVGNRAWVNIGEYGNGKNGGLRGNWEFKEGKRETPTPEVTPEPTPTSTPEETPVPTPTPTPEETPTPTPGEPTPTPEVTPTPTSEEPTPTPEVTPTPTPEVTPTPTPEEPTPTPEVTPTPTPEVTPTPTPEVTPTPKPKDEEEEQAHAHDDDDAGEITQTEQEQPITQEPTRGGAAPEVVEGTPEGAVAQQQANEAEQQTTSGSDFTPEELAQMQQDLGGN